MHALISRTRAGTSETPEGATVRPGRLACDAPHSSRPRRLRCSSLEASRPDGCGRRPRQRARGSSCCCHQTGSNFGEGPADRTPPFALSPDGTRLAFMATTNSRSGIWIRSLDSLRHCSSLERRA